MIDINQTISLEDMVSVIVPVYNAELFLKKCLDSIQNQTVSDIEVVLVNDGSKDASLEMCREYAAEDCRIKVVDQPNRGVSEARNVGVDNSTGDYLMFVDADDWLAPDAIESCVPYLGKYDVIRFSAYVVGKEDTTRCSLGASSDRNSVISSVISRDTIVACWGALFSRRLFVENNIRFDKALTVGEDWLVTAELIRHSRSIKLLPEVYAYYYNKTNVSSCTETMDEGKMISQLRACLRIRELFPDGFDEEFRHTRFLLMLESLHKYGVKRSVSLFREADIGLSLQDVIYVIKGKYGSKSKMKLIRTYVALS